MRARAWQEGDPETADQVNEPTAQLVHSALTGDRASQDTLLRMVYPRVLAYTKARLRGHYSAIASPEDITQDVIAALLGWQGTWEDRGYKFLSLVLSIADRKIIDSWRRADRAALPAAELPDTPDHRDPEWYAQLGDVWVLLSGIRSDYARVLWLRIALDVPSGEVAAILGLSSGEAVRVIQHRALEALRGKAAAPRPFRRASCGTYSGYMRHLRAKEQVCTDCRDAHRAYKARRKAA